MRNRSGIIAVVVLVVVAALLLVGVVGWGAMHGFAGVGPWWGWRMMGGYGRVGVWPFMLGGGLFWLLVIVGGAALIAWLAGQGQPQSRDSALEILRQRYARGEITKEQFDQMRRDLGA